MTSYQVKIYMHAVGDMLKDAYPWIRTAYHAVYSYPPF